MVNGARKIHHQIGWYYWGIWQRFRNSRYRVVFFCLVTVKENMIWNIELHSICLLPPYSLLPPMHIQCLATCIWTFYTATCHGWGRQRSLAFVMLCNTEKRHQQPEYFRRLEANLPNGLSTVAILIGSLVSLGIITGCASWRFLRFQFEKNNMKVFTTVLGWIWSSAPSL